jgi:hypothetical protein
VTHAAATRATVEAAATAATVTAAAMGLQLNLLRFQNIKMGRIYQCNSGFSKKDAVPATPHRLIHIYCTLQDEYNLPGHLVLLDSEYGVLHGLVCQGVHAAHKEVQGCQQLFAVLLKKAVILNF